MKTLDLLTETREQNKCLKLQVETLRQKLRDIERDATVVVGTNDNPTFKILQDVWSTSAVHQREEMIERLEKLNIKVIAISI